MRISHPPTKERRLTDPTEKPDTRERYLGAIIETKICSRCGFDILIEQFGRHSRNKDGLQPWCRSCKKESAKDYAKSPAAKLWREANREKLNERVSQWKKRNPEKVKEYKRRTYRRNREAFLSNTELQRSALQHKISELVRDFQMKSGKVVVAIDLSRGNEGCSEEPISTNVLVRVGQ